jgi:hypothetical protein
MVGGRIALTMRHWIAAFVTGAAAVILAFSFASGFTYSWISER